MRNRIKILAVAIIFAALGFVGGTLVMDSTAQATVELTVAQAPPSLTADEQALASVYQQVSPSVVAINVFSSVGSSSGSGFVIDKQGHILTNNHVVYGASDVVVNFLDGTITQAQIVGLDPDSDLAVIQVDIPQERLFPVTFGDSSALTVGQTVLAIGSPFGQKWTLTSGIISALDRSIDSLTGYQIGAAIQTDAAINPGNSGGPMLNLAGQVIGVNSQIISRSNSSAGIGFAVPSNLAVRVASELIETGRVQYSFIGIGCLNIGCDVNISYMRALDLADNQRGVVVGFADPSGPAGQAGIQSAAITNNGRLISADIITAINGQPINGFDSLIAFLAQNTRPGDTITVTVLRDGQTLNLPVTLSTRPNR